MNACRREATGSEGANGFAAKAIFRRGLSVPMPMAGILMLGEGIG
jgi:hypothetical protein